MRVEFGDYFAAFLAAGALCFVATGMVLVIGSRGRRKGIGVLAGAEANA